jgi:hypothetical protein
MNERIKELELEAAYGTIDPNGPFTPEEFIKFTEKFAELIVNQCADIAQQHNKSPVAAPLAIGYVIREHFGVKE